MPSWIIRCPATTANLGPGFDTVGMALSLYLTLHVSLHPDEARDTLLLTLDTGPAMAAPAGDSAGDAGQAHGESMRRLPVDRGNLVMRAYLHALYRFGGGAWPKEEELDLAEEAKKDQKRDPYEHVKWGGRLQVRVENDIPLARGLGSSAAAIVGGVLMAHATHRMHHIPQSQLLDWMLELEPHPDNVCACLLGGLVVSAMRTPEEVGRLRQRIGMRQKQSVTGPSSSSFSPPSSSPSSSSPSPPSLLPYIPRCYSRKLQVHPSIQCIVCIPSYELSTDEARRVLPSVYARGDTIHNLQRLPLLLLELTQPSFPPSSLSQSTTKSTTNENENTQSTTTSTTNENENTQSTTTSTTSTKENTNEKEGKQDGTMGPQPDLLCDFLLMDRLHQPYRAPLIPGLDALLHSHDQYMQYPGLLGCTLSGAGPTLLALVNTWLLCGSCDGSNGNGSGNGNNGSGDGSGNGNNGSGNGSGGNNGNNNGNNGSGSGSGGNNGNNNVGNGSGGNNGNNNVDNGSNTISAEAIKEKETMKKMVEVGEWMKSVLNEVNVSSVCRVLQVDGVGSTVTVIAE